MDAAYDFGACVVFTWSGESRGIWNWAMFTWGCVAMMFLDVLTKQKLLLVFTRLLTKKIM